VFVSYTILKNRIVARNTDGICRYFISKIVMLDGQVEARSGVEARYLDRAIHTEVHTPKPVTNQDTSYSRQSTNIHEINIMLMVDIKTRS
jgi:hypothetical protein